MHTVELLEQALAAAAGLGYKVRREWFGGTGGFCELRGQKWLFLDETASPAEHLSLVLDALRHESAAAPRKLPPLVQSLVAGSHSRKAA